MRVLLLVTDLEPGGTPLRIARLARGLRSLEVDVLVGCLGRAGPVSRTLQSEGFETIACDARGVRDFFGVLGRLTRQVRRIAPDLIHATLLHANVMARLAGRRARVPVLTSTATIEVERRWHNWLERSTAGMDCGQIVNSAALAEHVHHAFGRPCERIFVVPALIDPPGELPRGQGRAALGVPDDAFVVAWAGRFDPVKRLDFLVDCAAALRDEPFLFLLAGDGPLRASIGRRVAEEHLGERVRLLGWMEDLSPLYAAADAFAFPSRTEGQPNALLTALAWGLPCVASDIAPLRALHEQGAACECLDVDAPGAWLQALRRLRVDAAWRRQRSAQARDWAQAHLSPAAAARATLEVYRRVLDEPRGRGRP